MSILIHLEMTKGNSVLSTGQSVCRSCCLSPWLWPQSIWIEDLEQLLPLLGQIGSRSLINVCLPNTSIGET